MPPLTLEGDTLGEKHKYINKLVQDAVDNKQFNLTKITKDESDIHNLLQIDTACKTRNVDYIIEVLKCDDMLYVSRVIKHSTWLITEQKYAHIINPEYLYMQLFPHMLTKAINKLLLHIRLHLKDQKRAELFYEYLKKESKEVQKWLLNCSTPYIENFIQNEPHIPLQLFKRLCKRSVIFFQYYKKVKECVWNTLKEVRFLIKSNSDLFLDALEDPANYSIPGLGKKPTKIIMKKSPERILNNFDKYKNNVDLPTVGKYMKKKDIKTFLYKYTKNDNTKYFFGDFEHLKHFIKNMPTEDRFEYVKTMYIDKKPTEPTTDDTMLCCSDESACTPSVYAKMYQWYQYAPFNVALIELKKLTRAESSPNERCAILSTLSSCARNNSQNIKTLLQYYYDKHRNEPTKFKLQFVNNLITQTSTHNFDKETWNILDKLFHSLEVYIESDNEVQLCLKSIILYKVLHNEKVPDIVENKISLNTFKNFHRKLNKEQQNKIFAYLLTSISNKLQHKVIAKESDLTDAIDLLENALQFLKDWQKDLKNYPYVHDNIQNLLKIKSQNSWKIDFTSIYNTNKSFRRHMFEESMKLCPSEEVCLNILKHDAQLLTRYSDEVNTLKTDEKISLRRLLSKLRIYWPDSIAQQWTDDYLNNINKSTGHKAIIKGLFVLLPQYQLLDIAKKYVPTDPKIDWDEIDQTKLSVRKNIAKYLYTARPLIPLDVVLWYAIGDYLQYTVPSLEAIIHNMSIDESRVYMPKLLEAPVSLQKYGLHLAFIKLKHEELKLIYSNIWKTTKNLTIRARLFNYLYNILCKVTEPTDAKELWAVLKAFIENLTADDNKVIVKKLGNVKNIHASVQGEVYMKSYTFLASLPPGANCESDINNLLSFAPFIMDLLDTDFVAAQILSPIEEKICKLRSEFTDIISSYLLHGKTEEEQCDRFRKVLIPGLEHIVLFWNTQKDNEYVMKESFNNLLNSLTWGCKKFLMIDKIIVPIKLFTEIKSFMDQKMPIDEIYVTYTTWKLTLEYVKLVAEHKDMLCDSKLDNIPKSTYFDCPWSLPEEVESVWEQMHVKLSPELGRTITKHLKEDTEKYFPTICWLFSTAVDNLFSNLNFHRENMKIESLKYMVLNDDFIPSYIVVCDTLPKYGNEIAKEKRAEIRRMLMAHPSLEVQLHYHRAFSKVTELVS